MFGFSAISSNYSHLKAAQAEQHQMEIRKQWVVNKAIQTLVGIRLKRTNGPKWYARHVPLMKETRVHK